MKIPAIAMTMALAAAAIGLHGLAVMPVAGHQPAAQPQAKPAEVPFPPYQPKRMPDGHPNLNGNWEALVTADWDLQDHEAQPGPHPEIMGAYGAGPAGQSIVEGGVIPYQPWALAKKKENFEKRAVADVSSDLKWHQLGDPRVQVLYARGAARDVYALSVSHYSGIKPVHHDGV